MFKADWPAPLNVKTAISTREGGVSLPPYAGLNLGSHVHDRPEAVAQNRQLFRQEAKMPAEPLWLNQVHGTDCLLLEHTDFSVGPVTADASTTKTKGLVSVVLTADCLPVLFCDHRWYSGGCRSCGVARFSGWSAGADIWFRFPDPRQGNGLVRSSYWPQRF